jgi:heptosyltransferase II
MVMAQSLFTLLKHQHPDKFLDVLAPAWTFPLLERMPQVRQAIAMPIGHGEFGLIKRYQIGQELRLRHYREAIVLPNSWKAALIPFFAGIPKRTGYIGEARWILLNDSRPLDKQKLPMTVQRFVALGMDSKLHEIPSHPIPQLTIEHGKQQAALKKFELENTEPILALCPGAEFGAAKRWPVEHFAKLARRYRQEGGQVWLFGSEKDKTIASEICNIAACDAVNLCGNTSLSEAIDLLALANCVVSNDSGLMHVAAALNKPVIAIYGSSDPGFTPPLIPSAKILYLKLPCSPCFKRECPLGHSQCLTSITPELVWSALQDR